MRLQMAMVNQKCIKKVNKKRIRIRIMATVNQKCKSTPVLATMAACNAAVLEAVKLHFPITARNNRADNFIVKV